MMAEVVLFCCVFAACCVESIESAVITWAVAAERGAQCAIKGTVSAVVLLALFVILGGIPLVRLVPIHLLQTLMGAGMMFIGATWARKAILRLSGRRKIHTETERHDETVASLRASQRTGFLVAFQGSALEMLEVVLIALTAGTASRHLGIAGAAACSAIIVVATVAILARKQLDRLPETHTKAFVSVLLLSFGIFWAGEGLGLHWPASDGSLVILIGLLSLIAYATVNRLRQPIEGTL